MIHLLLLLMTIRVSWTLDDNDNANLVKEMNNIFNIPSTTSNPGPSNSNPTVGPCKCLPYNLCDSNKVAFDHRNPNKTGLGRIQIRFADEDCEESVDVCCTIPKPATDAPVPKPTLNNTTLDKRKGCGYRNPDGIDFTIVGPKVAKSVSQFGEFPWVVALLDTLDDSYVGAGVLIHPRVVLTVAHIVSKYSVGSLRIRAGEWDTKTTNEAFKHQERDVQQHYIHPEYFLETAWNDVALLHLETPVELDKHINTICLADQGENFDNSKNCIANGWGKDRFGKDVDFAVILKNLEIDMVEHSRCNTLLRKTRLGNRYRLHNSFVCAGGEEGKDMCTGDGGGPLACPIGDNRYKLAGLVVGGIGCGQKNVPGMYASLPALRSWVDEQMKMLGYGTSSYTI